MPDKKNLIIMIIYLNLLIFIYSQTTSCHKSSSSDYQCLDDTDNSNANCKYSYEYDDCFYCSNINKYFTIVDGNTCKNMCLGDKIFGDTKECTYAEFPDTFHKLGDVYYSNCDALHDDNSNVDCSPSSHTHKCNNFYSIEKKNGINIFNCYATEENSLGAGYKYYHYKTRELYIFGCPDGYEYEKEETISLSSGSSETIIRCSDSCLANEKYKTDTTSPFLKEKCVDSCDSTEKIYNENGKIQCVSACPEGAYEDNDKCVLPEECDFYDTTDKKCYGSCKDRTGTTNNHHKYGKKECISECTGEYKYKIEEDKICYKKEDCKFIIDDISNYECLLACPPGKYYDYN